MKLLLSTTDKSDSLLYLSNRLVDELNNIFKFPLTVVQAPMGYGKTTATREFLKKSGFTLLWQNLYDDSIDAFWKGFSGLFNKIDSRLSSGLDKIGAPRNSLAIIEIIELFKRYL